MNNKEIQKIISTDTKQPKDKDKITNSSWDLLKKKTKAKKQTQRRITHFKSSWALPKNKRKICKRSITKKILGSA